MRMRIPRLREWAVVRAECHPDPGGGEGFVATARLKRQVPGGVPHLAFRVPADWFEAYVEALAEGVRPVPPVGDELDIVSAWLEAEESRLDL